MNNLFLDSKRQDFLKLTELQKQRVEQTRTMIWINYPKIDEIATQIARMIVYSSRDRPDCAMIIGETGNGKSFLAKKILFELVRSHNFEMHDFLYVTMPARTRGNPSKCFYFEILRVLNHKLGHRRTSPSEAVLQNAVRSTLESASLRAIIIDEAHHIFRPDTMKTIAGMAEELKAIMDFSKAPVFLLGTRSLVPVIQ